MIRLLAKTSLRLRLTLLVSLLALAVTADQLYQLVREREASIAQSRERSVQIAVAGAAQQSGAIVDTRALLSLLKQLPLGAGDECFARLRQVETTSPAISSIFVTGADGITTCSSNAETGTNVSDRSYFRTMLESLAPVTSDYTIGRVTKRPGIIVGVPKFEQNVFVGGYFARLDAYWLSQLADGLASQPGAATLLLDGSGIVIAAAPRPEEWIGRMVAGSTRFRRSLEAASGVQETDALDGRARIVAHARLLPGSDEVLLVAIPEEAVTAPIERVTLHAMTKLGLSVLAALLFIWLGTERLIMRPLAAIADRARRIGDGDLPAPATRSEFLPELRQLAETLDSMAAKLAAREADLREANALLAGLAATDPLTGLGNRRDFAARSAVEWARTIRERRWIAAIAIDIDRFKPFNDRYGHAAGDVCLRKVATAIELLVRRPGDIVARTGGEEFVALLPGAQSSDAASIAERMRMAIADLAIPHEGSDTGMVTLSIGIADARPDRKDIVEELLARADAALYEAKQKGRDRIAVAQSQPFRLAG